MDALPLELCHEIFARLAGFRQSFDLLQPDLPAISDAVRTPLKLAATCKRWHTLVLNSPELWSFIHAHDERPLGKYFQTCLERSGQHGLDVWLQTHPVGGRNEGRDANRFMQQLHLLQGHVHRWRRIRIDFPPAIGAEEFQMLTKSMPLLEQLVLSPDYGLNGVLMHDNLGTGHFPDAPRLLSLATHAAGVAPVSSLSRLGFLSFSLRGMTDDSLLWTTLSLTPSLRELNIYYPYASFINTFIPPEPVKLPALRRLGLLSYPNYDQPWNKYLDVPNIDTLVISIEPCNNLNILFTTFRTRVRHLVITTIDADRSNGMFTHPDAIALDNLGDIETLELLNIPSRMMYCGLYGPFFPTLGAVNAPRWSANIRKLILRNCVFDIDDCKAMAAFVNSRMQAATEQDEVKLKLELINTQIIKHSGHDAQPSLAPAIELFAESIVQEPTAGESQQRGEGNYIEEVVNPGCFVNFCCILWRTLMCKG